VPAAGYRNRSLLFTTHTGTVQVDACVCLFYVVQAFTGVFFDVDPVQPDGSFGVIDTDLHKAIPADGCRVL